MFSRTLLVGLALGSLTAVSAQITSSKALEIIKSHASSSGHVIAQRQLQTASIADTCSSCDSFSQAMTPCSDESDYSCTCKDETLRYFIGCQQCQPIGIQDYPGGLPKLAQDAVDECRQLGFTVSDIDTSALSSTSSAVSSASSASSRLAPASSATSSLGSVSLPGLLSGGLLTATGTRSSPGSLGTSSPPNCAAICSSVCDLNSARKAKRQSLSDKDCMCTQAFFDSQYSCLACGTQLLDSDTLQRQGVDALKELQENCQASGYTGITTQDSLATFNAASTSFGGASSGPSTRNTGAPASPANSGGPIAAADASNSDSDSDSDNQGAGTKLSAAPGGLLFAIGLMVISGLLL